MLSQEERRRIGRKQAQGAAKAGKCPLIVEEEDLAYLDEHLRHVPRFGEYRPRGWTLRPTTYFVDASGFGEEGEPALTYRQFIQAVRARVETDGPGLGYAILGEGRFQVVIGEFVKEG